MHVLQHRSLWFDQTVTHSVRPSIPYVGRELLGQLKRQTCAKEKERRRGSRRRERWTDAIPLRRLGPNWWVGRCSSCNCVSGCDGRSSLPDPVCVRPYYSKHKTGFSWGHLYPLVSTWWNWSFLECAKDFKSLSTKDMTICETYDVIECRSFSLVRLWRVNDTECSQYISSVSESFWLEIFCLAQVKETTVRHKETTGGNQCGW